MVAVQISSVLRDAVFLTVSYADLFDTPIDVDDLHRRLIETPATLLETSLAIDDLVSDGRLVRTIDELVCLPDRVELLEPWRARPHATAAQQEHAQAWGRRVGQIPLVRMVAWTGRSTTRQSAGPHIDFFVVTRPRRLWLTRYMIDRVVRQAAQEGVNLQISTILSARSLELPTQSLQLAQELADMRVIVGDEHCQGVRQCNRWIFDYLPNSSIAGDRSLLTDTQPSKAQRRYEWWLLLPAFRPVELWQRRRALRELVAKAAIGVPGAAVGAASFSPDVCLGHLVTNDTTVERSWRALVASFEGAAK